MNDQHVPDQNMQNDDMQNDDQYHDAHERLPSLTADYLNGTLGPAETAELESLLTKDSMARQAFLDASLLHAQLAATPVALGYEPTPEGHEGFLSPVAASFQLAESGPKPDTMQSCRHGRKNTAALAAGLLLAAACLALILTEPTAPRRAVPDRLAVPAVAPAEPNDLHYDNRQLPITTVAVLHNDDSQTNAADTTAADRDITPSTLESAAGGMRLTSADGADVRLEGSSRFGFASGDSGALYSGSVRARVEDPTKTFSVVTSNLRVVDLGTEFRVSQLDADRVAVTVLDGDVEVQSRVRLPVCYWPFDDRGNDQRGSDQRVTTDTIQSLPAAFGDALQRCDGIVGQGAVQFDNSRGSFARVQGGTGEKVGLGTLSAAEGITVEALIISHWTAASMDYDEIYRKEDGNCRVLLSFQNDGDINAGFSEPAVPSGPCLSFGLNLAGRNYRELDMPLDGREGRPTVAELTDGRPHHVVATYDSFTGRKAIFIDGMLRCEHVCPAGTLIVSGGPEPAFIGSHIGNENFHGVIDELALYDFALTADEIAEHHERARRGETYFGPLPTRPNAARWQAITRITEGQTRIFNSRTGLAAE
ncbi:MAG: FecR domain-containing protein [Planctomycetia bacterium]|nr:FecR domain-containing protein [Planctomycetia bacterium]